MSWHRSFALVLGLTLTVSTASALTYTDSPYLKDSGLPPVAERLPSVPRVITGKEIGRYGGDLRLLMARSRDTRMMTVYGYARLVAFDTDYNIVPDLLESFDVKEGRIFTFKLRPGHKWSNGQPFTTEDMRYWWEDIANNKELSPFGPPVFLKVDGEWPQVDIIDETTIRYSWSKANPFFLPRLAAPRPPFIYRPSQFLKRFHAAYAKPEDLKALQRQYRIRGWAPLHNSLDNLYRNDNPDLPTLQPWVNTVRPPSQQFIFVRNPYFHRVDAQGQQLPYIDRVIMNIASSKLIPAKVGAGEVDLQARNLFMTHFTFLRQAEKREGYETRLWFNGKGAQIALYPNLNNKDPVWRKLFRDVRFRRALSLAIDRDEINEVIYLGLSQPANNTVLPQSPLFKEDYQRAWTEYDPDQASELLDELGLDKRNKNGVRLLSNGEPLEIVVETDGEATEQVDVMELIHDTWLDVGIKLFTRPSQSDVFRNRIYAGETQMAVSSGIDNGIPTADMSPAEFAPTEQTQYQWPKWGQYFETSGQAGQAPDLPKAQELFKLYEDWRVATSTDARKEIWQRMLAIYSDQVFSIGIVCCTRQPVVVSNKLRNVPKEATYSWNPGAYFGIFLPDTFYFAE